jgi:hypothetical protein
MPLIMLVAMAQILPCKSEEAYLRLPKGFIASKNPVELREAILFLSLYKILLRLLIESAIFLF